MNLSYKNLKLVACGTFAVMLVAGFTSCGKKDVNSPGFEFMPDMYRSPSLETNMAYVTIVNGQQTGDTLQANRMPVAGTIPRGFMPYPYPNTPEGYEMAGAELHNPLEKTDANLAEGEALYGKFCVHCHGTGGEADGPVAAKLSGRPPSYKDAAIMALPEGKMFHSITYGKGIMGSHASQVSKTERWKIIMYIHKLQYPNGMVAAVVADSSAMGNSKKIK